MIVSDTYEIIKYIKNNKRKRNYPFILVDGQRVDGEEANRILRECEERNLKEENK